MYLLYAVGKQGLSLGMFDCRSNEAEPLARESGGDVVLYTFLYSYI